MTPSLLAAPLMIALLKVTALSGAALLLLTLLRRSTATVRHMVCLLALCGSVLLIPLSFVPSSFAVPVAIQAATAAASAGPLAGASVLWPNALVWLWCAGMLLVIARYSAGILAARNLLANSAPVPNQAWRSDLDALGAPANLRLRAAPLDTAVTCGLFRPSILIPFEAAGWQRWRRLAVLMHELAHIRRRDLWSGAAAALATAIFWFHPFVWMLAKRMRREQECACDDAVLAQGMAPSRYAELLLQCASSPPAAPLFACAMTGRGAFRSRLVHVLDPDRNRTTRVALLRRVCAAASVAVLALAVLQPVQADDVHQAGGDVKPPKLIHKVEPKYTEAARDAKIEGTVQVDIIVGTDGRPRRMRIIRSLDSGLDNNALDALSQWLFEPGTKKGEPVAVKARVEINFRLQ